MIISFDYTESIQSLCFFNSSLQVCLLIFRVLLDHFELFDLINTLNMINRIEQREDDVDEDDDGETGEEEIGVEEVEFKDDAEPKDEQKLEREASALSSLLTNPTKNLIFT